MQPTLGQNIRQARKNYGMNQTVLAARVGISKTSLSLIESGDTKDPRYSIVRRIAQVLRLRVDDLDPLVPQQAVAPTVSLPPTPVPAKPPYDTTRHYLGARCTVDSTHQYGETGQTLRQRTDQECRLCVLAAKRTRRPVLENAETFSVDPLACLC